MTTMGTTIRLLHQQAGGSLSWPFFVVLVFWLVVLFAGFGLFARRNATVIAALFVGALTVAGAIFLILEMNRPYIGLMEISEGARLGTRSRVGRSLASSANRRCVAGFTCGRRHPLTSALQ